MRKPLRVLIVEDGEDDATLLLRELRNGGYETVFERVDTPAAMTAALGKQPWDLIISDYSMPRFNGLAALQMVKESGLDIPFLLVSGAVGEDTAVAAMKAGASDYLVKGHLARLTPAIERELREAEVRRQRREAQSALQESEARFRSLSASSPIGVFQTDARGQMLYVNDRCRAILELEPEECLSNLLVRTVHPEDRPALAGDWADVLQSPREFSHEYRLVTAAGELRWVQARAAVLRSQEGEVAGFVGTLESITESKRAQAQILRHVERLAALHMELAAAYDATLEGWIKALDLRDSVTEGHTQRVTEMTLRLAQTMAIGPEELVHVRRGALLHDIGKIAIPDHILRKPGSLSDDEWTLMRKHPIFAHDWLAPIAYLRPSLDIPFCHHEKWDGTGYPRGLARDEIPLTARMFAVVDVWDALSSDRPYRKGWPPDQVLAHIRSLAGTHFDPVVSEAFQQLIAESAGTAVVTSG